MIFTMEFELVIYPFKWEFFLTKMDDTEIFSLLIDDFLNPMAKTIMALEARGNAFREKSLLIEKELIKRLSDRERATYVSLVDKDDIKYLDSFSKQEVNVLKLSSF